MQQLIEQLTTQYKISEDDAINIQSKIRIYILQSFIGQNQSAKWYYLLVTLL